MNVGPGGVKNNKSPTVADQVPAARQCESSGLFCYFFFTFAFF